MITPERSCPVPDDSVSAESDVADEPLPARDLAAKPAPEPGPAGERPNSYEPL